MKTKLLFLMALLLLPFLEGSGTGYDTITAQVADGDYSFECRSWGQGYIGIGAYHNQSYELYYMTDTGTPTDDGVWTITCVEDDCYTIQNKLTQQFLSFCYTYADYCKYLTLTDEYTSTNELWRFVLQNSGYYAIQSVADDGYYFNIRTGTRLVGCYKNSNFGNNGMFTLVSQTPAEPKTYTVHVTGYDGGGVTYDGKEYGDGDSFTTSTYDASLLQTIKIAGYNANLSVVDTDIYVEYVVASEDVTTYMVTLLPSSDILNMENGESKVVVIGNPHSSSGYFFGYNGSTSVSSKFGATMAEGLANAVNYANDDKYRFIITKSYGTYLIQSETYSDIYLNSTPTLSTNSTYWTISSVSSMSSTSSLPTGYSVNNMVRFATNSGGYYWGGTNYLNSRGDINSWTMMTGTGEWSVWCLYEVEEATEQTYTVHVTGEENGGIAMIVGGAKYYDGDTFVFTGTPKEGSDFNVIYVEGKSTTITIGGTDIYVIYVEDYSFTPADYWDGKYIIAIGDEKEDELIADKEQWYLLKQNRSIETPLYDNNGLVYRAATDDVVAINDAAVDVQKYLVRFLPSAEFTNAVNIQFGNSNFFYKDTDATQSNVVKTTSINPGNYLVTLTTQQTSGWTGHYSINQTSDGVTAEQRLDNNSEGGTVVFWDMSGTSAGSNNVWALYPLTIGDDPVFRSYVTLDCSEVSVEVGSTVQLIAETNDSTIQFGWTSSDKSIATVNENGLVSGLAEGTAIITVTNDSGDKATCEVTVTPRTLHPEPMTDPMLFVHFMDNSLYAVPKAYISDYTQNGTTVSINTVWGETLNYTKVQRITEDTPDDLPYFTSYKFNNKFNGQLFEDVDAEIDSLAAPVNEINLNVGCIGKRLTASFKRSSDDVRVYVDNVEQESKVTRMRFDEAKKYVLARDNMKMLVFYQDGSVNKVALVPYGREVTVNVHFLTDDADNVPTIYINTDDGADITSKEYYKTATIRIDGAGVFPDMEETAVNIKGRGNTSWGWPKKPYRLKFDSKQKPFGMTKGKSWVLLSNYQTNSFMTNAIAMKVATMVETNGANHIIPVDLYLNGTYKGSYNFTEKVGFSNNSVEIEDESVATLLELDSYYDETYKFRSSNSLPVNIKEPDFSDVSSTVLTQTDVQDAYNNLETTVMNGGDYSSLIDIPSACSFFLVNELVYNRELAHPKSTFLYNEDVTNTESKWKLGPCWDYDWAFGYQSTKTYYQCTKTKTANYFNDMLSVGDSGGTAGKLWKGLCKGSEDVKKEYYNIWKNFMDNQLDELVEYIDEYYQYAKPSFEKDYYLWKASSQDQTTTVNNAKIWLRERAEYIFNNYVDIYEDDVAILGDVNGDGSVNITDVVELNQHLLQGTESELNTQSADVNEDGSINITDVVELINMILK